MKSEWLKEAKEFIAYACDECGCDRLAESIVVEFNNRFTRRMGDASVRGHYAFEDKSRNLRSKYRIRLSAPLWPNATETERQQTAIHEACHIIDAHLNTRMNGHGWQWKRLMAKCGVSPKRCHNVDRTGVATTRRRQSRQTVACGCSEGSQMGPTQYRRMLTGVRYTCRKCKQAVAQKKELV